MRRVILMLTTIGLAVLIVSGEALAKTAHSEVPDAPCQPTSSEYELAAHFSHNSFSAQTFTAEHTGLLTRAQVMINSQDDEADIVMEIRPVDSLGAPAGAVLASTTIPTSGLFDGDLIDGQFALATGHFSPGAPVEAGQQYAIVLGGTSAWAGYSFPLWRGGSRNPCLGVLYGTPFNELGTWIPFPRHDVFFSTFVTARRTKADCKKGGYKEYGFKNQCQCIEAVKNASR